MVQTEESFKNTQHFDRQQQVCCIKLYGHSVMVGSDAQPLSGRPFQARLRILLGPAVASEQRAQRRLRSRDAIWS